MHRDVVHRRDRSRLQNYREQIDALGPWGWLRYKVHRIRCRASPQSTERWARTRLAAHPVIVRAHTSDTNVFSQIFIHREYRCLDAVRDPSLIIDCGANVGYSSVYFLTKFPTAQLIAVEPHAGNFAVLSRNLAPYGDRCTALQRAIWSSPGGLVVSEERLGDKREWAIQVRPVGDGEIASVEAVDIGSLLEQSGHDRISILKVDIEGSEAEVFSHNIERWIDRVDNLVIEIHGKRCHEIVMEAMEGRGFTVSTSEELTVFTKPSAALGSNHP